MNKHIPHLLIPFALALTVSIPQVAVAGKISTVDWDNDGISDEVEELIGSGVYLADTDGDGILDKDEIGDIKNPRDTDKDGKIDIIDLDDDGDGIPTVIEGAADKDKDGKANYLDTDSDGDGLADGFEVRLTGSDKNGDHVDDLFDVEITRGKDVNGDGIDDNISLVDSNKNGVPDLLDKKSSIPHLSKRSENNKTAAKSSVSKKVEAIKTKAAVKPVVVAAATLPNRVIETEKKVARKSSYLEAVNLSSNESAAYGGSGYFYCGNSGKIVKGITGFMMTPPGKVTLVRNASEGDYKWQTEEPGTYALQFQIPAGMSIVRGLAKGRRIVKQGESSPLVLGGAENSAKKGYLVKSKGKNNDWYTSFEIKDGAPLTVNNNIPLSGGVCDK